MKIYTNYFSLSVAKGDSFFNREDEIEEIKLSIMSSDSIWMSNWRRFGKTSALTEACRQLTLEKDVYGFNDVIFLNIDLSSCATKDMAYKLILKNIATAGEKCLNNKQKALKLFTDSLNGISRFVKLFGLTVGDSQLNVELRDRVDADSVSIGEALRVLDNVAVEQNIKIIMMLDEYQQVNEIVGKDERKSGNPISWDIRSGLQHCENISIAFCGSHKRMMEKLIEKEEALYKMCSKVELPRFSFDKCKSRVHQVANECRFTVEAGVAEAIYNYTNGHPRDFTLHCREVFKQASKNNTVITISIVDDAWQRVVVRDGLSDAKILIASKMSAKKKAEVALLYYVANHAVSVLENNPSVQLELSYSATALRVAKNLLIEEGWIYVDHDGNYEITEPLIKDGLIMISADLL
ncbi:hypothetical protein [Vibrio agarivorans]|uniref:hypothetical protein n=1 Tax=Vibrio agarivorans TaxID=153622 RepID=UPI0025B50488|nr:hypothetical protein [Vibrio agarivorans]MDN3662222.1 hypothetical protein [Vibrio agarivorans]